MSDPRSAATPDLVAAWSDFAAELIADFGEFGCDAVTPETKGVGELRMTEILRKHPEREEMAA